MTRREQWRPVLEAEVKRWSAMSREELISALVEDQNYEVEFESRRYQIEVQLLEKTPGYVHVLVAVDDVSLPASLAPLTSDFIVQRVG
jgi:hypothetical protein